MPKMNISPEGKITAAKSFLNRKGSKRSIAAYLGISLQLF
jgi:transposase-like protein